MYTENALIVHLIQIMRNNTNAKSVKTMAERFGMRYWKKMLNFCC